MPVPPQHESTIETLSPQQRECLRLVAELLQTKEIARQLSLSTRTVDGYLDEAKRRLGATTRREAARMLVDYERRVGDPRIEYGGERDRLAGGVPLEKDEGRRQDPLNEPTHATSISAEAGAGRAAPDLLLGAGGGGATRPGAEPDRAGDGDRVAGGDPGGVGRSAARDHPSRAFLHRLGGHANSEGAVSRILLIGGICLAAAASVGLVFLVVDTALYLLHSVIHRFR